MTQESEYLPGRILVEFKDGVTYEWAVGIIKQLGYSVVRDAYGGFYPPLCVAVPKGREEEAAERFRRLDEVEYASRDLDTTLPKKKRK